MRAEFIRRLLEKGVEKNELMLELEQLEALARKSTQGIRQTLYSLQPRVLKSEGLSSALAALLEHMREVHQLEVSLEIEEQIAERLSLSKQIILFQIIQEIVNKASIRTESGLMRISLAPFPAHSDLALMEVKDPGIGVAVQEVQETIEGESSPGILNLQERTDLINGRLNFETSPEEGTCIQVTVPLTEQAADWLKSG